MVEVWTTVANIITLLTYMLIFYSTSVMAQIRRHMVLLEYDIIGKRITVSYFIGFCWSAVLVGVLYFLEGPIVDLYNSPEELRPAIQAFYYKSLSMIPIISWCNVATYIVLGLSGFIPQLCIGLISAATDIGTLYVFAETVPEQGVDIALYSQLIAGTVSGILSTLWIFQPHYWKLFSFSSASAYRWWDKEFSSIFMMESGWMFGRGLLEMGLYIFSPIFVSNLGGIELATYSIQSILYFFPPLIADSVGRACSLKGAEYLASKKKEHWRKLLFWVPPVTAIIILLICCGFLVFHERLFNDFTNDNQVIYLLKQSLPYWVSACMVGSLPGTMEGLAVAKEKWDLLFYSILLAVLMWLAISLLNEFWVRELPLLWGAIIVFLYMRWLPLAVIVYREEYTQMKEEEEAEGAWLN